MKPIKFPHHQQITLLIGILMVPLFLLFHNATSAPSGGPGSYDPTSLLTYYHAQAATCTATNHTACPGEVTQTTYKQGPLFLSPPGCTKPTTSMIDMSGCGFSLLALSEPLPTKTVIFRGTGVYTTSFTAFDQYALPTGKQEYSSAYSIASGLVSTFPTRTSSFSYYYNEAPIVGDPNALNDHILGLPATSVVSGGDTVTTTYLATGKPSSIVKNGIEIDYTYDSNGNLYQEFNWRGGTKMLRATHSNYVLGMAQSTAKPDGSLFKQSVNAADGTITSKTDALGNTSGYTYDLNYRLSGIIYPAASSSPAPVVITHPDENSMITQRGSKAVTTYYDVLGREIQKTIQDLNNPANSITTTKSYDPDGRLTFQSLPVTGAASLIGDYNSYDVLNRLVSQTHANGAITNYRFTAPDSLTITRPTGESTIEKSLSYGSPSISNLVEKDENLVGSPTNSSQTVVTKITRDIEGKILQVNQAGVIRQFAYDSNQRLSQITEPERATIVLGYYAGSTLLQTQTVGSRAPIAFSYDALDRPLSTTYSTQPNDNVTYSYDLNGRLISASTPLSSVVTTYDSLGNQLSNSISIDGYSFEIDSSYDSEDRKVSITYPDPSGFTSLNGASRNKLLLSYDGIGRVISESDLSQKILSSVSYNPNGIYSLIAYNNGVNSNLSLTVDQRPMQLQIAGGSLPISLLYSYDPNGNVSSITDQNVPGYNQIFTYDGMNRLTSASYPNGAGLLPTGAPFPSLGGQINYSPTGDILSYGEFAKAPTSLNYNATTQLLTSTTGPVSMSYTYNDYGQMLSNSINSFNYDPNFNLTSISQVSTGAAVAYYTYDARDLRVKKVVSSGRVTYYAYIGSQLAFEATQSLGTKEYFYLGNNLISARSVSTSGVASYAYYHFNPIQSTIAQSDPSKNIIQEHYNAYGSELLPNSSFTSAIDLRFAGHVSDDESGLIYMNSRYFDPRIARFIEPDPVDFRESNTLSFNKYAYANNNPLRFIDPDGRDGVRADSDTSDRKEKQEEKSNNDSDEAKDNGTSSPSTGPGGSSNRLNLTYIPRESAASGAPSPCNSVICGGSANSQGSNRVETPASSNGPSTNNQRVAKVFSGLDRKMSSSNAVEDQAKEIRENLNQLCEKLREQATFSLGNGNQLELNSRGFSLKNQDGSASVDITKSGLSFQMKVK